jgi:rubrerythrin
MLQRHGHVEPEASRDGPASAAAAPSRWTVDPLRWIWLDPRRRGLNLLRFAAVEADGGRDLVRAAELTPDPVLRRLFLKHAADEQRHAELFRRRGLALLAPLDARRRPNAAPDWLAPGERGLDDLQIEAVETADLLAFLHLSESSAARDFGRYSAALADDPATRAVFQAVLRDEAFHMIYTRAELRRVAPQRESRLLWKGRLGRVWKVYLRLASGVANLIGAGVLTFQYYVLLPPFAWLARRAARQEVAGWTPIAADRNGRLRGQY